MDDRRLARLAERQAGLVTTSQLQLCGLTRSGIGHRVTAGRLFPVRRGVYALSPHLDPRSSLWAVVLAVDPERAAVSHWSALEVHGMSRVRTPTVHVTVPGTGTRRGPGFHVHGSRRFPATDTVLVDGLRLTSPGRSVLDVADRSSDRALRRLIREGEFLGLLPIGEMSRTVATHPGHPGAARVRRVDPATVEAALAQTPLEDDLESLIQSLPLPAPGRQLRVRGVSGAGYDVDFGWPGLRLAVEADGRAAHERVSSLESDRFRDNDLAGEGWLVLRFTRSQIVLGSAAAGAQIVATAASRRSAAA